MKRTVALGVLFMAMVLNQGAALADAPDNQGPKCADLGSAFGIYATDPSTGHAVFTIELTTHDPSCAQVSYVLHEFNGLFTDQVQSGNGTTALTYSVDLGPAGAAPTEVCVFFTSELGRHVADRSPDAAIHDCVVYQLDPDSGGGGEGFDQ
jgi:hypothetical protein